MKKQLILLTAVALLLGSFASCNQKVEAKKEIVIAIIPKVDNAIFAQVKESSIEAARDLGVIVTWEAPTTIDGEKQKEIIENLIHYKVDGILISCNDVEILKDPINDAIKAGIKVATFDSDCPVSDRLFYIGTDSKKAGQMCAETMTKLFEKAHLTPDHILVLSGGMNANNMNERIVGLRSSLKQGKISDVIYSFEMCDYGKELLTLNLNKDKHINGVQMLWGVPVLNGVDSIPALAKMMKNGGVSVFFDVSKPLLKYISRSANCATMSQDFHSMGYQGVKNLVDAINGKPVPKEILFDVKVIDQTNATDELKNL